MKRADPEKMLDFQKKSKGMQPNTPTFCLFLPPVRVACFPKEVIVRRNRCRFSNGRRHQILAFDICRAQNLRRRASWLQWFCFAFLLGAKHYGCYNVACELDAVLHRLRPSNPDKAFRLLRSCRFSLSLPHQCLFLESSLVG